MKLLKGISAGTTALIHPGEVPALEDITAVLDPVRGVGADLLVTTEGGPRAFTPAGEITPPSAAVRLAAAYLHREAPSASAWDFHVDGLEVAVSLEAGEYAINHGPWSVAGGARAASDGQDSVVRFSGLNDPRPGLRIRCGGSAVTVSALASSAELGEVDFSYAPSAEPGADLIAALSIMGERAVQLTDDSGANIGTQSIGALQVRGYDARIGEVFSADALAVASAAAARTWFGEDSAAEWIAVFGGGTTRVVLGENAIASAEAEIFAEITWQASAGG